MALQPSTLAAGHPRGTVLLGVLVVLIAFSVAGFMSATMVREKTVDVDLAAAEVAPAIA